MGDVAVTLLGTSGAWPIPRPGCGCPQCAHARAQPAWRRTRSGLLVRTPVGNALVDASPDVAWQFEREGLAADVDLVVISHYHHDHVLGLDDLVHVRAKRETRLPVHCGPDTHQRIHAAFPNLVRDGREKLWPVPWHRGALIELGPVLLEGFETHHRTDTATTGVLLRVRRGEQEVRIAYATDMGEQPPEPAEVLEGVDLFVGDGTYLGAGGYGHPGTERMIAMARALGAQKVAVTHVGHWGVDPDTARRQLPADVVICRDGDDLLAHV